MTDFSNPPRQRRKGAMPLSWRAATGAAALALVVGTLALTSTQTLAKDAASVQAPTVASAASAPAWGHELVNRAPDPAVRFGRLPNGLRYAIQHNETPKDGVAMRLRIGAGSLQERDDEQGLAHFLEHMAFRGSAKVPDGEVVHMLQRQGLTFGPDTNAFTAQDQTVYMFNFPKADATALDTGFTLFREIGEHLTLDAKLLEQEKGVVLSEERAGDVPMRRAGIAEQDQPLVGTRVPLRWPIGHVDSIKAATAERLGRFYRAYYRPGNATLIVVGNVDVDAVERQIRERFADWKSAGQPDKLDMGSPKPTQPVLEFVADGAPDVLKLNWLLPPDTRLQTLQVEREQMIDWLGVIVLNMRLTDRTLQPGSPFLGAGGFVQHQVHDVAGLASLQVTAPAEQWQGALDAALQTLRQLLAQGVQPADLQRVLPLMRSALQAMVAQAPTREHAAIADALVNAALPRGVYQSAAQGLAEAEPMLASVTAEEITTALRRLYGGATPLLFRSVKAAPAGTEALSQQLAQSLAKPVVVAAPQTVADWPYTDFGAASAIVSKTTDAELGATTVQFANGTRLVVKPTAQEKDKLSVQVLLGQGRAGLAREHVPSVWALDFMPLGGTGKRSLGEQLQWQQSTGRLVGVRLSVAESAFVLQGDTRPADLAAELQVLAAYARDPGFRPEMGEKMAGVAPMMANQFETLPGLVFAREMSRIMNASEPRIGGVPTAAELLATRPEQVPAMLREALAGAPDVVIVGDVSLDAAVAAVHATFGAGPNRARLPLAGLKLTPAADGGESHVVYHKGRADQAELGRIWPMPDRWTNPALSDTGRVAAAILQTRLIDSVREKLGITYSPNVGGGGSVDVAGQGSFQVFIETPPDKFDTFRSLLLAQLTELAAKPVSADELQRAKQPMIEDRIKAPEHNGHWGYWLPRILNQPRMKAVMLGEADDLRAITAEQVQALFRDHIVKREPIEVVAKAR